MSNIYWDADERITIEHELERLFILHDKRSTKEQIKTYIEKLEESGIPSKAILSAILKLQLVDMPNLKAFLIIDAARSLIDPIEEGKLTQCDYCDRRGIVTMQDDKNYHFALACACENGQRKIGGKNGLIRWSGDNPFYSKGRWLRLRFELAEN